MRFHQRMAGPVLIAALAAVPAAILMELGPPWRGVGQVLNTVAAVVIAAESIGGLVLAEHKRRWIVHHLWLLLLVVLLVPTVIFAAGPLHLLRVVHLVLASRPMQALGHLSKLSYGSYISGAKRRVDTSDRVSSSWRARLDRILVVALVVFVIVWFLKEESPLREQVLEPAVNAIGWSGTTLAVLGVLVVGAGIELLRRHLHAQDAGSPVDRRAGVL